MRDERQWTYDLIERGKDGARVHDPDLVYEVRDYDGAARARFRIGPDAKRYVRDRNREDGTAEVGDAHGEVDSHLRMSAPSYSLKLDTLDDATQPVETLIEADDLSLVQLLERLGRAVEGAKAEPGAKAPLAFDVTIERHDS